MLNALPDVLIIIYTWMSHFDAPVQLLYNFPQEALEKGLKSNDLQMQNNYVSMRNR